MTLNQDRFSRFMGILRTIHSTPECPPFITCYRHVWQRAHLENFEVPSISTARRLLKGATDQNCDLKLPDDPGARFEAIIGHASSAADVYVALGQVVEALRAENQRRSGDDRQLGLLMCGLLAAMAVPAGGLK